MTVTKVVEVLSVSVEEDEVRSLHKRTHELPDQVARHPDAPPAPMVRAVDTDDPPETPLFSLLPHRRIDRFEAAHQLFETLVVWRDSESGYSLESYRDLFAYFLHYYTPMEWQDGDSLVGFLRREVREDRLGGPGVTKFVAKTTIDPTPWLIHVGPAWRGDDA